MFMEYLSDIVTYDAANIAPKSGSDAARLERSSCGVCLLVHIALAACPARDQPDNLTPVGE